MREIKKTDTYILYCAEWDEERCGECFGKRFIKRIDKPNQSLKCTKHKSHIVKPKK